MLVRSYELTPTEVQVFKIRVGFYSNWTIYPRFVSDWLVLELGVVELTAAGIAKWS